MKKYFFIAAIAAITIFGCNQTDDEGSKTGESDTTSMKEQEEDSTMLVFSDLNLNGNKDTLGPLDLIRSTKLVKMRNGYPLYSNKYDVKLLRDLLCDTNRPDPVTGIKFFIGGVRKKNHEGNLERMYITIMQIQRLKLPLKDNEYEYTYYNGDPNVCPEPTPCYLVSQ